MIKRILVFALSFVLLCTALSVNSVFADDSAADADTALNDNSVFAVELLEALDIAMPDISKNTAEVTRADFISGLMSVMKCADSKSGSVPFSDVAEKSSYYGAVANALSLGIISPDENFFPQRAVTADEAYKMAVTALGYGIKASLYGGYPAGYVKTARECEIDEDINAVGSNAIDANDFYALIKNILNCKIFDINSIEDGGLKYKANDTVLEKIYDVYITEGVITADSYSSLYDPNADYADGYVTIDSVTYKCEAEPKLGFFAKAYVKDNAGTADTVLCFDLSENNVKTLDSNDFVSADKSKAVFENEDKKDVNYSLDSDFAILYNGKACPKYALSDISGSDGYVELVDNDDNGKYNVVSVNEYTVMLIDTVNSFDEIITDQNSGVLDFGTSSDIKYNIRQNGTKIGMDDIPDFAVAQVYKANDGKLYKIIISTDTVTGKINGFRNDEEKIVIDDKEYGYGSYFKQHYLNKTKLGESFTFSLSADGIIEAALSDTSTGLKFGYFIALKKGSGIDDTCSMKLLDSDGEIYVYDINEKVYLDAKRIKSFDEIYSKLYISGAANEQLIRYGVNRNNEINKIDTYTNGSNAEILGTLTGNEPDDDKLVKYTFCNESRSMIYYMRAVMMVTPHFYVPEDCPAFVIGSKSESEDIRYCVDTVRNYFNESNSISRIQNVYDSLGNQCYEIEAYNVDRFGICNAVVIKSDGTDTNIKPGSKSAMINDVTYAVTPDGGTGLKLEVALETISGGYRVDTSFAAYYIENEDVLKNIDPSASFNNPCLNKGDIIRFSLAGNNIIRNISRDFDRKKFALKSGVAATASNHGGTPVYYFATVYSKNAMIFTTTPIGDPNPDAAAKNTWRFSGTAAVYDSDSDSVVLMNTDSVLSYTSAAGDAYNIIVRMGSNELKAVYIYR